MSTGLMTTAVMMMLVLAVMAATTVMGEVSRPRTKRRGATIGRGALPQLLGS